MNDSGQVVGLIVDHGGRATLWTMTDFEFSGFYGVANAPVFNVVAAGKPLGVGFSLHGNRGLYIFEPGYPTSQRIACDAFGVPDPIEETIDAALSRLLYKPQIDRYIYAWKTEPAWAGTCRQLNVRLNDGTNHIAYFSFR